MDTIKLAQVNIGSEFIGNSSENLSNTAGVSTYISNIITASISIAGIILLFLLIAGGIGIIAGAGKSDPKTVETGKKAASSALIGFIVVFSAYWIVKLIESITGLVLISQ
jgi:hypothetical protein